MAYSDFKMLAPLASSLNFTDSKPGAFARRKAKGF
jgi:hypothetical protein